MSGIRHKAKTSGCPPKSAHSPSSSRTDGVSDHRAVLNDVRLPRTHRHLRLPASGPKAAPEARKRGRSRRLIALRTCEGTTASGGETNRTEGLVATIGTAGHVEVRFIVRVKFFALTVDGVGDFVQQRFARLWRQHSNIRPRA
jgi:hypothetical protein